MTKLPRVVLDVVFNGDEIIVDNEREYAFEQGVEYVLRSSEPIWITWSRDNVLDKSVATKQFDENADIVIDANDFTTFQVDDLVVDEHVNNEDHLFFLSTIANSIERIQYPVKPKSRSDQVKTLFGTLMVDLLNQRIDPSNASMLNNILTNIDGPDTNAELNILSGSYDWTGFQYFGIVDKSGQRYEEAWYKATFDVRSNGPYDITLKTPVTSKIYLKTGLVQYVADNGSNEVRFIIRSGDFRKFYINNAFAEYEAFECSVKERQSRYNISYLFDSYIIDKYPKLVDVMQAFIDMQMIANAPGAFISNVNKYHQLDKMPEDMLARTIDDLLGITSTIAAEKRLTVKRFNDFLRMKGTLPSVNWLARVLFNEPAKMHFRRDEVLYSNKTEYNSKKRLYLSDIDTSIDESFIGYDIAGQRSKAIGVIEDVFDTTIAGRKATCVEFTEKQGEFDSTEVIEIASKAVNLRSIAEDKYASIIAVEVVHPGKYYKPGQAIIVKDDNNRSFYARIATVNNEGGIRTVNVLHSGFYYRKHQTKLVVPNDRKVSKSHFAILKPVFGLMHRHDVGYENTYYALSSRSKLRSKKIHEFANELNAGFDTAKYIDLFKKHVLPGGFEYLPAIDYSDNNISATSVLDSVFSKHPIYYTYNGEPAIVVIDWIANKFFVNGVETTSTKALATYSLIINDDYNPEQVYAIRIGNDVYAPMTTPIYNGLFYYPMFIAVYAYKENFLSETWVVHPTYRTTMPDIDDIIDDEFIFSLPDRLSRIWVERINFDPDDPEMYELQAFGNIHNGEWYVDFVPTGESDTLFVTADPDDAGKIVYFQNASSVSNGIYLHIRDYATVLLELFDDGQLGTWIDFE